MTLNKEQSLAANTIEGPLLILAGAGTGKTTTLIERIGIMIEKGIHPSNILAVTFTNKAAGEMRERLGKKVSFGNARLVHMGTFHSICYRILKDEWTSKSTSKFSNEFTLLSPFNVNQIVKGFINRVDVKSRVKGSTISSYISALKNELVTWDDLKAHKIDGSRPNDHYIDWDSVDKILNKVINEHVPLLYGAFPLYERYLIEENLLDLDDLLVETAKLFLFNDRVLNKYQEVFKYILVDEYQDSATRC